MTTPDFTAGFNAGIAAAVKWHTEWADHYADKRKQAERVGNGRMALSYGKLEAKHRGISDAISALTVPSDMVAVPREPDEAMIDAGKSHVPDFGGLPNLTEWDVAADIYRAMLAAHEEKKG